MSQNKTSLLVPNKFNPVIVVIGGGSGPLSIEDSLLNQTSNVIGLTGIHDNGGHSGDIRSLLGVCPPGDATHRLAVRIRDTQVRDLLTYRWKLDGDNHINGHRTGNELLALAERLTGSHSKGVKLLEKAFSKHLVGRVIPVSDDRQIHLRAIMDNGTFLDCEDKIDQRKTNTPAILDIDFIPQAPKPNPEAIEALQRAEAIIISPSSWYTSILPILRTPGITQAIQENPAPVIWFCNAFTNFGETHNYKASDFAKKLSLELKKKIDYAFINEFDHPIPEAYAQKEQSFPVEPDVENCQQYTQHIYKLPLTELVDVEDHQVVRHNGEIASKLLIDILQPKVNQTFDPLTASKI